MKIPLYNSLGKASGDVNVSDEMFATQWSDSLVYQAMQMQLSNARQAQAKVKTRSDVRGGGRKPFRQKGTGRARQGTIRAPQFRGGGVVFGPTGAQNYSKAMPKKMRRKALFCTLSLRASEERVLVLSSFDEKKPSTKAFASFLKGIPSFRKVLVVSSEKSFVLDKSVANLPNAKLITSGYLNVVDVMNYDMVLFLEDGIKKAEEIFLSK